MKLNKVLYIFLLSGSLIFVQCSDDEDFTPVPEEETLNIPPPIEVSLNPALVEEGKDVFRFATFGDETFWSGVLQLDKAILGEENGGFGLGFSPNAALSVGLKVDADALPQAVVDGLSDGSIDLDDPATTVALLNLDAVLGVVGNFDDDGNLASVGINCALCHSTVDDSFGPGIGSRLDGWPNRDMNAGAIIASTNLEPLADILGVDVLTAQAVLNAWGPGRFDGALLLDGQPVGEDGLFIPAAPIPAIFGLQGINPVSYTGFGDVEMWSRFVAVVELGGQGNFSDPRLNSPRFPIAVLTRAFDRTTDEDLVEPVIAPLLEYIASLLPPVPEEDSFDRVAAIRGQSLFSGKAQCASCHAGAAFSDNILRDPDEIGIDGIGANRYPSGKYRTTPLRALFTKSEGGYFHDGRFSTLDDVVVHYDDFFNLELTENEQSDLVQYLKAL